MSTGDELFTIGQLARRSGVPARTIRFWSDIDLIPVAGRSVAGYRLYDATGSACLDLVKTLRELGLGLDAVRSVLARTATVAELAALHVTALDTQIRVLRLRRALLRTIAARDGTIEEALMMHKLAQLSARERQQIIDDFVDEVFAGVDQDSPGYRIASGMRQLPASGEVTPEQLDAWIELGELVGDPGFRARARQMAVAGETAQPGFDGGLATELASAALAAGTAPGSAVGRAVLDRIVAPQVPATERAKILQQLETFTDARVERYWQLLAIINGQPPQPPVVPAFDWLIAALRATA